MLIGRIEKGNGESFSGKEAAVIYAQGCNLRCAYCGYASYLGLCEGLGTHDWDYAESYLEKRLDRLEGVVFSGGEPTLHEDLGQCMKRAREMGLAVKLETNGTRPEVLRELIGSHLPDYISMDVKAPLENYANLVGRRLDAELIRTSIWLVKHSGIPHEFITTVVPGLHTTRELKAISELVHGADRYVVQDFISSSPLRLELKGRPAFPDKALEDMRPYVEKRVKAFEIRHSEEATAMPSAKRRRCSESMAI
ncbi:MAG: anaerobic ribonucleoside-triphosphate reductase activating protein [Oceanipulchritudo sp.]